MTLNIIVDFQNPFRIKCETVPPAELAKIKLQIHNLMSAISEFKGKQDAFNAQQGAAIDQLVTSTNGLAADVQGLKDKIDQLQNNPGPISPEDQAILDQLVSDASALSTRTQSVADALAALDAQTPPVAPIE